MQGMFPDKWKTANILFQKGLSNDLINYRPTFSKVTEKHVHEAFVKYLKTLNY